MSRKWRVGMAAAAAALAVTALAAVHSNNARMAPGGIDLSGTWTLDASQSDLPGGPGRFEGRDGRGRGNGERWSGRGRTGGSADGMRGPRPEGRRGRGMQRYLHVVHQDGVVAFSDSTGAVIEVIRTAGAAPREANPENSARELTGRWDGGTLIAEWNGPRGGTVVRSYTLGDDGRTLEIRTERKGVPDGSSLKGSPGDGPPRFGRGEFKLVYRRAS